MDDKITELEDRVTRLEARVNNLAELVESLVSDTPANPFAYNDQPSDYDGEW